MRAGVGMDEGLAGVELDADDDTDVVKTTKLNFTEKHMGMVLAVTHVPPRPLVIFNMSVRLFARDASTLNKALKVLHAFVHVRVSGHAFLIRPGLLLSKLFGIPGLRSVDLESEDGGAMPTPCPEPIATRMRRNGLAFAFAGAQTPMFVPDAPGYRHAVDVELFSNLARMECGVFWYESKAPSMLLLPGELMDMHDRGDVVFGLNIHKAHYVRHDAVEIGQAVYCPVIRTGFELTKFLLNSSERIDFDDFVTSLLGFVITLRPDFLGRLSGEDSLPVITGVTIWQDGVPLLRRDINLHGKTVDSMSYLISLSNAFVEDANLLFEDWFVERQACVRTSKRDATIQLHFEPAHVPLAVSLVGIYGSTVGFSRMTDGEMPYQWIVSAKE